MNTEVIECYAAKNAITTLHNASIHQRSFRHCHKGVGMGGHFFRLSKMNTHLKEKVLKRGLTVNKYIPNLMDEL